MAFKQITSRQNHFIKYMLSLKEKKVRDREKTCLIEGEKILSDLADKQYPFRFFFTTEKALSQSPDKAEKIAKRSAYNFITSEQIMKVLSGADTPAGFIAAAETPYMRSIEYEIDRKGFFLCCDTIQDPGNLGTIFRTAAAFNISGIILYGNNADPFGPKTIRASSGQTLLIPILYAEDRKQLLTLQTDTGISLYASSSHNGISIENFAFPQPSCIILGNEGKGISENTLSIAKGVVKIPTTGQTESLNVSSAAAIAAWEWYKQSQSANKA